MNGSFLTKTYMVLCMASRIFAYRSSISQSPEGIRYLNGTERRMPTINIRDSRGKRHNLPLVEVENADLHRIATCTKAPGRLICKSGRYNYVINNGNFEFPAETLEKFVSALYQKAKDHKESDFAVSLVAPEKDPLIASTPTANLQMATVKTEATESVDQLQPVTIECELTDAKTLRETNPDYQPKPNERVFKCITKRLGIKKKRHHNIFQVHGKGSHETSRAEGVRNKGFNIDRKWKVFQPMSGSHVRIRASSSFSKKQPRDVVKKSGFEPMVYGQSESAEEGNSYERSVAGYYHHEFPRPRVRDYSYTLVDAQSVGWCPPLKSTGCLPDNRMKSSTLHPVFYTESSDDRLRKYRHKKRRIAYKYRNPLLDFFMPYGLHTRNEGSNPKRREDEYLLASTRLSYCGRLKPTSTSCESPTMSCGVQDSGETSDNDPASCKEVQGDEDDTNQSQKECEDDGNNQNTICNGLGNQHVNEKARHINNPSPKCHIKKQDENSCQEPKKRYSGCKKGTCCQCPMPQKAEKTHAKFINGPPKRKFSDAAMKQSVCNPCDPCERKSPSTICTVITQKICFGKRSWRTESWKDIPFNIIPTEPQSGVQREPSNIKSNRF